MSMAAHMSLRYCAVRADCGIDWSANSARRSGKMERLAILRLAVRAPDASARPRRRAPAARASRRRCGRRSLRRLFVQRAINPGVSEIAILREHVDLGSAQRGLEPRLYQGSAPWFARRPGSGARCATFQLPQRQLVGRASRRKRSLTSASTPTTEGGRAWQQGPQKRPRAGTSAVAAFDTPCKT